MCVFTLGQALRVSGGDYHPTGIVLLALSTAMLLMSFDIRKVPELFHTVCRCRRHCG